VVESVEVAGVDHTQIGKVPTPAASAYAIVGSTDGSAMKYESQPTAEKRFVLAKAAGSLKTIRSVDLRSNSAMPAKKIAAVTWAWSRLATS
jgi:hypothetical protein